jgi:transposase-like protein
MNVEIEKLSHVDLIELVKALMATVEAQAERISELEARLKQSSRNSSKPPSHDWKGLKNPRVKSGASQGGQPGHKGNYLRIEREAEETIELKPEVCQKCGTSVSDRVGKVIESRHKIDVEIRTKLTKYEQVEVICPCCGTETREEFPANVKSRVSYGEGVQSIGVLLTNYANVSYGKTQKIMNDVLGVPLSTGTLVNHVKEFAEKSSSVLAEICVKVKSGETGHFDETSVRVNGANQWLHTAGNSEATYNTVHAKRGKDGTDDNGVLGSFGGVAVHDCWSPYFQYANCAHSLCNAHLLRELQGIIDNTKQTWAVDMAALLREMKKTVDEFKLGNQSALPEKLLIAFAVEYDRILKQGETESPRDLESRKQSKSRNLLDRFTQYRTEITRFADNFAVPFDNNQAERDIRNTKVKMKVSGGFRSNEGAKNFAKISSVIGTAVKQGSSAFRTVADIFAGSSRSIFQKPQVDQ